MAEVSKKKLTFFLIASILTITFVFYAYQILYTPNILVDKDDRTFVIRKGYTFRNVQEELGKAAIVNDMVSFSFLARVKGYDKRITPGRYALRRNMTNLQAIGVLSAGQRQAENVTFTNVRLVEELSEKITKNIGVTPSEFDAALEEFVDTNTEGFTQENVLSMFLPNTYEVYYNVLPDELIERMHDEYKKFWNTERLAKAQAIGLTPLEVSTLASIVQAESVKKDEADIIAGLYINRLKKNIPLQADPTLVFATRDFTLKRVLNKHKEIDSHYNTYKYAGLPPGPINLPQIATIDAVLNYKKHDFIYMCAREDFSGYHNFASTLTEHNRNASRYQKALDIEMRIAAQKKVMYISTTHIRVRYGETDQMGYVYYGNYAMYYEVARVESLRQLGLTYKELEEMGVMMPVLENKSKFLSAALYDDNLRIVTTLREKPTVRIRFEYEIFNGADVLIHQGETLLVFVDKKSGRPCRPPEVFQNVLKPFFS